jgi:O-antigen/teichoic acid export membrane protein
MYGLSNYIGVFASIFLTPIYTRILSKADYGVMDIFLNWNNLFVTILPFGLIGGLLRFYPEYKTEIKSLTGTILAFLLLVGALYGLVMILLQKTVISNAFNNAVSLELYLTDIFIVIGSMLYSFSMSILRCEFKKTIFLLLSLINISLIVSLGFIFVYYDRMGVIGFFRATLITVCIMNVLGFVAIRKKISFTWNRAIFKHLFNYSFHILGVSILFQLVTFLDRKIILNYCSLDELGIYAIGAKISSLLNLIFSALLLGWFPRAMSMKDNPKIKKIIQSIHNFAWIVLFPFIFIFFTFNNELIQLFAPAYNRALLVVFFLSISIIFIGFNNLFYNTGLHILSKTKYITYASLFSLSSNVFFSLLLVNDYGIYGVAFGTFLGSVIWLVIQYIYNRKLFNIHFNLTKPILYFIILCCSFLVFNLSEMVNNNLQYYSLIFIKIVACLVIMIYSYFEIRKYQKSNSTKIKFKL